MNPHIRYQQINVGSHSYKLNGNPYNQMSTNLRPQNNQTRTIYRKMSQQIICDGDVSRNKSINKDVKPYPGNNLLPTMSYRMQSSTLSPSVSQSKQNNRYHTSHNFYRPSQVSKGESANDFFNQVASQISQQPPKMQKVVSQTFNQPIQAQPLIPTVNRTIYSTQEIRIQANNQTNDEKDCQRCAQLQCQIQKVMKFMREQLQIGVKQYTDKMNKIVLQQAKQIMDLRKLLINNQKSVINFNKQSASYYQSNSKYSPGKSQLKSKSPSKLSLTRSNTSISPHHSHKQKIAMVSKQLSPSKTFIMNRQKSAQNEQKMNSTLQNFSSSSMTVDQLSQKIKILQQKVQVNFKLQSERNQKIYVMNKRLQVLEKGLVNIFAGKIQRVKQSLSLWLVRQQQKQNNLYKEIKVISNRVGTLSGHNSNPLLNTHSSPLIPQIREQPNSPQLNSHKMLIKLKKFSSQIQDLRQILTNLQTKQFKYDNYQMNTLAAQIQQIREKLSHLDKAKYHISNKLIQTEQKLDQAIQASKYSKISSNNELHHSAKEIQRNSSNVSIRRNNNNYLGNNSVQLTYNRGNNQSLNEIGTKSMKTYQYPQNQGSKLTKATKFTSQNYSNFQPHSHSQYKGYLGEQSQISQFMNESGINYHNGEEYNQEEFQESFHNGSSQQENDEQQNQEEDEEDEFFYPVDLGGGQRQEVNGLRVSASNSRMSNQYMMSHSNNNKQDQYPSPTIHRFMQVIEYRQNIPLKIQIDQTGYIKSAQNGMYIVDRNMDGFDLNKKQLEWLKQRGIIIIEH